MPVTGIGNAPFRSSWLTDPGKLLDAPGQPAGPTALADWWFDPEPTTIEFRGAVSTPVTVAASTWTVTAPVAAADDLIVVALQSSGVADVVTAFSGFTFLTSVVEISDAILHVYYAVSAGSEPSTYSVTFNQTTTGLAACFVYRNVDPADPLSGTPDGSNGASATAQDWGPYTPDADNSLVVALIGCDPAAAGLAFNWDAPWKGRFGQSSGTAAHISLSDLLQTTAAAASPGGDFSAAEPSAQVVFSLNQLSAGAIKSVAALVSGASTVTAATARTRTVAALVSSPGTVTAATARRRLAGPALISGASTVTGATARARAAAALVTGASTVTAAPVRRRAVAALVGALSTVTAAPVRRRAVAALVGAASTVTAATARTRIVAALVSSASTVAGLGRRIRAAGGLPGYAQAVADDAPLIWWRMNDATPTNGDLIPDAGSLGLAGSIVQTGIVSVAHPLGLPNAGALELDATVGGALVNGTAPAASLPSSAVTVECWYRTDYAVNWHNVIGHDWGASANPGWLLHLSSGAVIFGIWHTSGQKTADYAMSYADGQWHHLAGVYDPAGSSGTGQVRTYVDGALVATADGVGVYTLDDVGDVYVGASTAGSAGTERAVAEVAVYGTALSDARIAAHYAAGRPTRLRIGASSTVTAAPARRRTVAALVGAASTVTAAPVRRRAVAAVVGASSTVTAAVSVVQTGVTIAASVTASSTVTATASARRTAAALIAGTATVVAAPKRRRVAGPALVGSISTVTVAPGRRKLAGPALVAGAGTVTAATARRRAAAALVGASSTVTVAPARRRVVLVAVTGAGTVTAAPARRRAVAAVVSAASSVTVSRILGGIRSVVVLVAGASSVTAAPKRRRTAAVLVASSSTTVALPVRRRAVAPLVGASSTVTVQNRTVNRSIVVGVGAVSLVTAVPSVPVAVLVYFVQPVYP